MLLAKLAGALTSRGLSPVAEDHTPDPEATPKCSARYPSTDPTARIVRCGLFDGHDGDHDELIDGEVGSDPWPRAPRVVCAPEGWGSHVCSEACIPEPYLGPVRLGRADEPWTEGR